MFGKIKITDFGKRHFGQKFGGTKIVDKTTEDFEIIINSMIDADQKNIGSIKNVEDFIYSRDKFCKIIDGYAPFCKLISVPNFTNAKVGSLPITNENYQYLRFEYSKRRDGEIAYLKKFFDFPVKNDLPIAKFLIIVVYDREQLLKEYEVELQSKIEIKEFELEENDKWGIVAILAQDECEEQPITPETMINNHMGIKFGGSGVELNIDEYEKSVKFWSENAIVL